MKLNYDFERYEPPKLSELKLNAIAQKRQDLRRMFLLAAASNLIFISLALLALAVFPYSMLASILCLAVLGIYLAGSGVIAVLFTKKLMDRSHNDLTANLMLNV